MQDLVCKLEDRYAQPCMYEKTLHIYISNQRLHHYGSMPLHLKMSDYVVFVVSTGYTFPKDCTMVASTINVHMDPKIYSEPMSFNPSRFQV